MSYYDPNEPFYKNYSHMGASQWYPSDKMIEVNPIFELTRNISISVGERKELWRLNDEVKQAEKMRELKVQYLTNDPVDYVTSSLNPTTKVLRETEFLDQAERKRDAYIKTLKNKYNIIF